MFGGELVNCATNSQVFTISTNSSNDNSVVNNYGIIDFSSNTIFTDSLIVNNYLTLNVNGDLDIRSGAIYHNYAGSFIDGDLTTQNILINDGSLTIATSLSDNSNGYLTNSGNITTNNWTINGEWINQGTIDVNFSFVQSSGSIGTIAGGCMSANNWTNRGTITGTTCGDINIASSSEQTSSGSVLGDIAIIDATPPGAAPFIDTQNGTVGPNIVWISCNSCPSEEICNNNIDDDGDGYTDGDDPDCITVGNCGCPPGGTIITDIPFAYSIPAGSSHCLDADETLNTAWNNVSIAGNLYILSGNTLTVNSGDLNFTGDGSIILCDGAGYVNEAAVTNPTKIYNYGWLQICGSTINTAELILGENSMTAFKGDDITINDTIKYVGNPAGSAYIFADPTTSLNGISSGNTCIPGSTKIRLQSNNPSITPTCVTDCNGCPELSTISGTCHDGSVEAAYLALNPNLEICGNSIDDNNDGRTDEPFPGGVQTDMQLWLKAETGTNTTVDGNDVTAWADQSINGVTAWADQSINGYSANADVNSTDDPTYSDNEINYNPGIVFDGTYTDDFSDGLHLGSDYIYSTNDGLHIFAVVNTAAGGLQYDKVYDFGGVVSDGYSLGWSENTTRSTTPGSYGGATSFINHFTGPASSLLEFEIKFNDSQTVFQDGATAVTTPITLSQLTATEIAESDHYGTATNGDHTSGPVSIGRKSASQYLDQNRVFMGAISEVLVYNDTLAQIEKEKIQSYLASKYGITINHNYLSSSGTIIKDISDGYTNNITVIGRDDCSGLNQKQSKSADSDGIISISRSFHAATNAANTNTISNDESFLAIGNNGATANSNWINVVDTFAVIDRIWKIDPTNYSQTVDVKVNVDNPNFDLPPMPANANGTYYLLTDDDGDFTNGGLLRYPLETFDGISSYSRVTGISL